MKIEFIKRGAATRLILIFAGWSTDARYYEQCVADGWDTAVVSDYTDMRMPEIPAQYATVYVFAYSLGVAAAALSPVKAAVRVAVCGSPLPASDSYGIPEAVYAGTLSGLDERSLMKFHLRMAGDKATFESIKGRLPHDPDIARLKNELSAIRNAVAEAVVRPDMVFDRVYIAREDRIFPYPNLLAYWSADPDSQLVVLDASHAVDLASVVKDCLPDGAAIGEGFAKAVGTYNDSAVIQREICVRIREKLQEALSEREYGHPSLLEIGVGQGLLTQEWSKVITPSAASYIDLTQMPTFGIAPQERYIEADAESWLENSDEKFDIILSASTIQWFVDPIRFIASLRSHLNPGGIAVVSTFVKGNLHQLDNVRPCPIIYHTEEAYRASADCVAEAWERTLAFPTRKDMLMHLKLTGVSPGKAPLGKVVAHVDSDSSAGSRPEMPKELTYRPMILMVKA